MESPGRMIPDEASGQSPGIVSPPASSPCGRGGRKRSFLGLPEGCDWRHEGARVAVRPCGNEAPSLPGSYLLSRTL